MQKLFQKFHNRVLPFFLAVLMLASTLPLNVLSTGAGAATEGTANGTPSPDGYIYDYDTLKITRDGKETYAMDLLSYEKITISADGVEEKATYQWQILHNEKEDVWIDIYDANEKDLPVTLALLGNLLRDDNTAKLRCRAYTEDYAYLTSPITVTVKEPVETKITLPTQNVENPSFNAEGDEPEHPEFVTVTIEYMLIRYIKENGEYTEAPEVEAFSPYIATLAYNSSLNTTVDNPSIVGFTPYFDGTACEEVPITLSAIKEDVTYKVLYKPSEDVSYRVQYLFQNVYDDLYSEDKTVTGTDSNGDPITGAPYLGKGTTGLPPSKGVDGVEFEGFTTLYYQPDTIAADGSTAFEVYFERNYYLMEFDCNGGYGVNTVYVRYGTYVSIPTPVRPGYVFAGWDLAEEVEEDGKLVDKYDGVSDSLLSSMPSYNSKYKAIWSTADTTYTVVYWARNGGDLAYLGSRVVDARSSDVVSGKNDLSTSLNLCGLKDHQHSSECGYSCSETTHVHDGVSCICKEGQTACASHTIGCYSFEGIVLLNDSVKTPSNPEHQFDCTYDGVTFGIYKGIFGQRYIQVDGKYYEIESENTNEGKNFSFSYKCHVHTDACCTVGSHVHQVSCYACGMSEHAHTESCRLSDVSRLQYVESDQNQLVLGDGSTILNVYYKYKTYTLRFYYAATTGTGTDSDGDGVADSFASVKIIGGSTYSFGKSGTNTANDETLLNAIFATDQVGTVTKLPQLNATGKARNYTLGTLTSGVTSYHYIEFAAYYGQDISELWPCAVFESATRTSITGNKNGWTGDQAFVSAWNGEHHVYYSQHNENQTIKGKYEKLDYQILFDSQFTDETTVSYLCFWENGTHSVDWNVPKLFVYNIWVSVKNDEDTSAFTTKVYNGVKYKLIDTYDTCDNSTVGEQTQPALEGYNAVARDGATITLSEEQKKMYSTGYAVNLYYSTNYHTLSLFNYNEIMEGNGEDSVAYETPLSNYQISAADMASKYYPEGLEPGAYEFAGWYTTSGCYDGTEVDWAKDTMPDGALTLYAKWVPVQRNVYFFEDLNDLQAFEDDGNKAHCWQPSTLISYPIIVDHGTLLGTTYNYIPTRTGVENSSDYHFVGWFYFDETGKKKFAPDSMEVDRDLYLFAEWKTLVPTTYHIEFEAWKKDSTGTETKIETIANALEDYSTAGKTVTFDAAGGNRLYDLSGAGGTNYCERWFPETASHSLLMDADSDNNTYTFRYFNKEYINYKVIYKDRVTGKILGESDVKQTYKAIVTEKYKPFENYYPEQYYIERPIAYDPTDYSVPGNEKHVLEENIIYFYYIPDTEHAPYHVDHYKANVAGDGYDLAKSYQGIADLNKKITEPVSEYTGFVFDHAEVFHYSKNASGDWVKDKDPQMIYNVDAVTGTVTLGGLDIEIYYKRIDVGYTIRYMQYGTDKVLQTVTQPSTHVATFGSEVSNTAPAELQIGEVKYAYYLDNSTEPDRTQSMTIRENAADNVLTFYYKEKIILVKYHVVCTVPSLASNNAVSLANERAATPTGLAGSNAMPGTGFTFKGWFMDAACTTPVPTEWLVTDKHLKPLVLADTDKDGEEHLYALFEPIYGALKIEKEIDGTGATGATFLFRVQGTDTNNKHIDIIVSIQDDTNNPESVLLNNVPIGKYTVTELTDWSWEFTANTEELTVTVEKDKTAEVSFTNTPNPSNWLSGETVSENQFKVTPTP
jgi:uncharacterized repeat protein (TIGR02543 family)